MSSHDTAFTPHRPRLLGLFNQAARALVQRGALPGSLDALALQREAQGKVGLDDFGDASFAEPLSVLTESIEREARLHPIGRAITRLRLLSALVTRLRVERYLREQPALRNEPLPGPIVIAGLQRTGTTLLHRLLAQDARLRAVMSWEVLDPVGPARRLPGIDPRKLRAKLSERALRYMAPEFFAIHPVEADAPEEEVLLLDYSFRSTVPEATLHVPTYAAYLETVSHLPAYQYLALLLRILARARRAERFVLKTPHHLEHLDSLTAVFPRAQIIQTHRDPTRTLASFCSMVAHGRGVFSDEVDLREVGAHWSRKVGRMLSRSLSVRADRRDAGFIDVSYYDLIEAPVATLQRLYEQLGMSPPPRLEELIGEALRESPRHKYGQHSYRLADFGLSAGSVEPLFAAYRERFGVRHEA